MRVYPVMLLIYQRDFALLVVTTVTKLPYVIPTVCLQFCS